MGPSLFSERGQRFRGESSKESSDMKCGENIQVTSDSGRCTSTYGIWS